MKREEYQKVKKIFQTAIELEPEKRADFLDKECLGDDTLRKEVERLLDAIDNEYLEEPAMVKMAEAVIEEKLEIDLAKFLSDSGSNGYFSHYKILSKIGQGGMGEVFLAEDIRLDRKVAIKVLSKAFSEDPNRLPRFVQEAKSASALNHPNIITVYEIRQEGVIHYIVNEYIEGETLSKQIAGKKLSYLSAVNVGIQIASALAAAHEAGIIHRDIKPDNIMIRKDGIVKILDFGLAKPTTRNLEIDKEAATLENVLTLPGMVMGTPQYMAPEQICGQKTDARADIFSFGIVFYEMLTEHLPFAGKNWLDTMSSILKDEPLPLEKYIENASPELENIVKKSLEKDPEDRYQNIKDLLGELENLKEKLKIEAKLSHDTTALKAETQIYDKTDLVKGRRFSLIHAAIFLLITIAIVSSVWWFTSFEPDKNAPLARNSFPTTEVTNWSNAPGELFSTGTFSPNGNIVAFSSTRSGKNSIWIKQTNSGDEIQVTKDDFENKYPVWSPNGDEIAFISTRNEEHGIWRVPALGGSPQLVTTFEDAGANLRSWAKSGKIYFESDQNLFAFDTVSGEKKQITNFDSKTSNVNQIVISPDEKQIAYLTNDENNWKILVKEIGKSEPLEIIKLENEINNISWTSDGKRILYSALTEGVFQIFAVGVEGGEPVQVSFSEKDSIVLDVSQDGRQILLGSAREESTLWYVELESSKENLFKADIASELWQSVSPDNQTVAFQSIQNLSQGNKLLSGSILTKKVSADSQSVRLAENGFLPNWSADGKTLAYLKLAGEKPEIWTVNDSGGNSKLLTTGGIQIIGFTLSPYNLIETKHFSWSPVRNEIAYISDRKDGANVWLVSSEGSSDVRLTNHNDDDLLLFCPVWSSDGKKIAYSSQSKTMNSAGRTVRRFWVYDKETNETKQIFETDEITRLIGWTETGEELIYASTKKFSSLPPEVLLYNVSVNTGEKKLVNTLKDTYYYNIQLSPDRRQIAFVSRSEKNDDIWVAASNGGKPKQLTKNNNPRLYFSSLSWSPDGKTIFFGKQSRFSILSMISGFK